MIFTQLSGLAFHICLTILCTPIFTIFFQVSWQGDFIIISSKLDTQQGDPFIGRSVVCSGSPFCFSSYSNNPPYLCFPCVGRWYAYCGSYIRCGFLLFKIIGRFFSSANKVCSLVSIRVDHFVSFPPSFLTPNSSFHILGALVWFKSSIESFVVEAFHKDFGIIYSIPMLVDL